MHISNSDRRDERVAPIRRDNDVVLTVFQRLFESVVLPLAVALDARAVAVSCCVGGHVGHGVVYHCIGRNSRTIVELLLNYCRTIVELLLNYC